MVGTTLMAKLAVQDLLASTSCTNLIVAVPKYVLNINFIFFKVMMLNEEIWLLKARFGLGQPNMAAAC